MNISIIARDGYGLHGNQAKGNVLQDFHYVNKTVSQEKHRFPPMSPQKSLRHSLECLYNIQFKSYVDFVGLFLDRPRHLSFRSIHFYLAFFVLE